MSDRPKYAILLTSCVRETPNQSPSRLSYYLRAIDSWLNKTNLPIFIVESSNYNFPEFNNTRLKVCSFDLQNQASSSQYEAKSILFAMEAFKEELKEYTHVLKVTARYYIECENLLQNLENVDLILQYQVNHDIEWNNSEVFGFRNGLEHELLDPILNLGLMESRIYNFSKYHSHKRLPPIKNVFRTPRGGDGLIFDPL
jgi:hypothetical protein